MKKWLLCVLLGLIVMTVSVRAAELPKELITELPKEAGDLLEGTDYSGMQGFAAGIADLLEKASGQLGNIIRQRVRGAAAILLVVILCGAVDGFREGVGSGKENVYLPMVSAMSVTMLSAGSLDALIGLGVETVGELNLFSKVLLPTLAAATAAAGSVSTATFQQVTTVFLVDLLLNLINGLLIPLMYLYIGVLTASSALPGNQLEQITVALKKIITWILTTALLAFTLYLSVARVISGGVDGSLVKITRTTVSGVVPVVGSIIAEVSETVLAGAGLLKNTIGVFGMLSVLAVCVYPFLQLGVQYLLYKFTAFLASVVGAPSLCKLIDGLAGAFGLILGMTGSCAALLLVSVLSSIAAVVA